MASLTITIIMQPLVFTFVFLPEEVSETVRVRHLVSFYDLVIMTALGWRFFKENFGEKLTTHKITATSI